MDVLTKPGQRWHILYNGRSLCGGYQPGVNGWELAPKPATEGRLCPRCKNQRYLADRAARGLAMPT